MIIYRTWDGSDMALSDTYFPTLKAAIASLREDYGIKGPIKLNAEGEWEGTGETSIGRMDDIHLERLDIEITREGLCYALKHIPHR